jgi:hypothetical protein
MHCTVHKLLTKSFVTWFEISIFLYSWKIPYPVLYLLTGVPHTTGNNVFKQTLIFAIVSKRPTPSPDD